MHPSVRTSRVLPEPKIRHLERQVGVRRSFPLCRSALHHSAKFMADARWARAEHRAALATRAAQTALVGEPPHHSL